MIPKIIHYCWFGKNPLPKVAEQCIESWRRMLPDYTIMHWDESNFDVSAYSFSAEAYALGKYAFVADVCRIHVLYHMGGIYLDTDMLFIKDLPSKILEDHSFIGWENQWEVNAAIIGAQQGSRFMHDLLNQYKAEQFQMVDGHIPASLVIPHIITKVLLSHGLEKNGIKQHLDDYATIYPSDYFYPKDYMTGYTDLTINSIAIHLYDASWHSEQKQIDARKSQYEMRLFRAVNDLKSQFTNGDIIAFFYRALKIKPWTFLAAVLGKLTQLLLRRLNWKK